MVPFLHLAGASSCCCSPIIPSVHAPVDGLAASEEDDGGHGHNLVLQADLGQLFRLQPIEPDLIPQLLS